MKKPILFAGALVVLLATLFVLFSDDAEEASIDQFEARSTSDAIAPEGPVADSSREEETDVAIAPPIEEAQLEEGPPASYTKALGGLIGRVVEPDGTPKPEMKVELLAATLQDFLPDVGSMFDEIPPAFDELKDETLTDSEGRFRFVEMEPRGIYVLGIDFGGSRATIRFVDHAPNPGETVDLGDIVLDPYVVFTGRVVDGQRAPVAGARVRATNLPSILFTFGLQDLKPDFHVAFQEDLGAKWRVAAIPRFIPRLVERFPIPTAKSADDGTFRLEGVPLGMATVLVDKPGLVSLVHGPVPTGEVGEKEIGDLRLEFGEELLGRVVDADDEPIANAVVIAGPKLELAPAGLLAPIAVTNSEGYFSARGLDDREHIVAARPQGAIDWTLVTDVVPGFDEPEIVIGDTHRITVTAYAESGELLPNPALVLQSVNQLPLHPLIVPPISLAGRLAYDEDGRAVVTELDPGKYSVLAKTPGYTVGKIEADVREGPDEVELILVPELGLSVRVVEAESGKPVHWATAGIFDNKAPDRAMRRVPIMNRRTDAEGFVLLNGLEAKDYAVAVFHPAYAEAFAEVSVPGSEVVVELRQGGAISGVILSGGRPPAEDRFIATGKQERFPRFTVTDVDGTFEMTHLEPGEYTLTVMRRFANQSIGDQIGGGGEQYIPERFEKVTVEEGKTTFLEIDLLDSEDDGPKATLRGRVVVNGRASPGYTISARADGNWRGMKSAITDSNGRFDFGQIPAKKTRVSVSRKGKAGMFQFGRLTEQEIELEPGEIRDLNFELDTGGVTGRVVFDRDGAPVLAAEIRLRASGAKESRNPFGGGRVSTVTGRDGRFSFDDVASGSYTVSVRKDGAAGATVKNVVVPPRGAAPPVEVRLEVGVVVKGTVVLPPEMVEPPRFLFLEFRSAEDGERQGGDRVDRETLEFVVEGIRPGRYEVRGYGGRERFAPVEVQVSSNGAEGLVVELKTAPPEDAKSQSSGVGGGG